MASDGIGRLAGHVTRTAYADLPPEAVRAVGTFVLDTLGVGVAGSGDPWAARLGACAAGWGGGDESTVWGSGQKLPALSAALVNGYQVHCLEYDSVHERAVVHALATLLPALLAQAERRGGATGEAFVTAVAVGVDVACSIGAAARGPMRFFRPATAGAFGAVAALGKLEGLDAPALTDAFGIAYSQLCGTLQAHLEASPVLGMQMGFNARGALTAVDLAATGLRGPREVLEGRYGYFRLFEDGAWDLAAATADLGKVWRVTELSHKPFPSGRLTHGTVDGLLRLRAEHGFGAGDVARVTARVPPLVHRLVGRPDLPTPGAAYARLCLPFVAASALLRGAVDVPDFRDDRLGDPRVHELAQRVEVVADGNPDENAMVPQTIEVTLRDGRRFETRLDRILGNPARPLSPEQHLAKFRRCWGYGARPLAQEAGETLIARVGGLAGLADVRELAALTAPG